jgi:hypothetical protein
MNLFLFCLAISANKIRAKYALVMGQELLAQLLLPLSPLSLALTSPLYEGMDDLMQGTFGGMPN